MYIEEVLLVVKSILLVATIILLLFNIKEGRGRKALLLEVGRAIKVLTRQEYFLVVADSLMDAKVEVIGSITGRVPVGDDKKRTKDIINNIERLTRNEAQVKYLLPKFPDRLHIGYLYTKAGAEIRYSNCPTVHDIRYMVVDDRSVVIGIPEVTGEKEATRKGYMIPSEGLATMLREYFDKCCGKSISYEEYVKEVVKQAGATPKLLAQEFRIDEKELERFAG